MGDHVADESGTITAVASTASVGEFVITATVSPDSAFNLDMTDDSGDCYVWNNGAKTPATAVGDTIKDLTVTVVVTYSGTETLTAEQTNALWVTALNSKDVIITATTDQSRFKFGSADNDYSHATADMKRYVAYNTAKDWAFDQSSNKATSAKTIGHFYVSIDGNQGAGKETVSYADTSLSGTITFTPSVGTGA